MGAMFIYKKKHCRQMNNNNNSNNNNIEKQPKQNEDMKPFQKVHFHNICIMAVLVYHVAVIVYVVP